jgi:hypothetical protein
MSVYTEEDNLFKEILKLLNYVKGHGWIIRIYSLPHKGIATNTQREEGGYTIGILMYSPNTEH